MAPTNWLPGGQTGSSRNRCESLEASHGETWLGAGATFPGCPGCQSQTQGPRDLIQSQACYLFGDCPKLVFLFSSGLSALIFFCRVWHQISCQGKFLVDGFPRSFENMEGWKKVLGGWLWLCGMAWVVQTKAVWICDGS